MNGEASAKSKEGLALGWTSASVQLMLQIRAELGTRKEIRELPQSQLRRRERSELEQGLCKTKIGGGKSQATD